MIAGSNLIDRKQVYSQVANFPQDPVKRRLVDHPTGEERCAVCFQCDVQPLKPVLPLAAKMAFYSYLINHRLTFLAA